MTDRILLTGANSLLGRALSAALDPNIYAVDNDSGDLRDTAYVESLVAGADSVIHLAPLYTRYATDNDTLDAHMRGTYQLVEHAAKAGVKRLILGSSLNLFHTADALAHRIDESWRPQPGIDVDALCAWLAEVCARETARVNGLAVRCLRFGDIIDDDVLARATHPDPRWLHIADAVRAVQCALALDTPGWSITHISAGNTALLQPTASAEAIGFAAAHPMQAQMRLSNVRPPAAPSPSQARPIRSVVVFGAGGPLGAAVTAELQEHYTLRLADLKSIDALLESQTPQSQGAPLPVRPDARHSWDVVDVRDPAAVHDACAGMDAIINLSVLRNEIAGAFQVNALGARNVMSAAIAHGIHRVVHTGPFQLGQTGAGGYSWDDEIFDDVPPRPGTAWLYLLSKLCGQEIVKAYARRFGMSVPTLTFCEFVNPAVIRMAQIHPLSISWQDSARAVRAALEVPSLPSPYEYMHIGADLPHARFPNEKAKRLLKWQPRDNLAAFYARR